MPHPKCAVWCCGSCRRTKGIGIWKLPSAKYEVYMRWRDDWPWLDEITKTRAIDQDFRQLIASDRVFTCEEHFVPEDIKICK